MLVVALVATEARAASRAPTPRVPTIAESPDLSDERVRRAAQAALLEGLLDAGLPEQALAALAELRAAGEDVAPFLVVQAEAMHATGLTDDALGLLDAYLRRHRRDADAHATRGLILSDAGRVEDAVVALERAVKLRRDDAALLNNLGFALLATGDATRAEARFREALRIDPGALRVRNNLGFALARLERDDEALAAFRAASDEATARYNLGVACESRGDATTAITQYRAALEVRPGHAEARARLERLLPEGSP